MQKKYLLFLSILFLMVSCGSSEEVNVSTNSFLNNLTGVYEGVYKDTTYEIWIEEIERITASNEHALSIFIFEKSKSTTVEQFLAKYPDTQSYSNAICKYVQENPDKLSGHNLQESPSMYYDISADQVWKWNNLGSLGYFTLSANNKDTSFEINIQHYINFPENDEHALKSVDTNANGTAKEIHFLETGFIKKPWNYVFSGPSIEVTKSSTETKSILKQYLNIIKETQELFSSEGKQNRSYCDTNPSSN